MRRFKMLVFSEPFAGRDNEFNAWYTNQHLGDLVALPGFTSAQRFTLHSVSMGTTLNKYLAIYDVETDDPDGVIEGMFAARDTSAMPMSSGFTPPSIQVFTISTSLSSSSVLLEEPAITGAGPVSQEW